MTNIDRAADIIEYLTDEPHLYPDGGLPDASAQALDDEGLLAPDPQIIRTREELAALDPDTLVAMNPITKGHATAYVWSADTALRVNLPWHAPLAIIATGEQVRAARRALEEA